MAMLSRGVAGIRGHALIVNLPGRPRAVRDNLAVLMPVLAHAVTELRRADTPHTTEVPKPGT